MRAVFQRVKEAKVFVGSDEIASIGTGGLVLLGVGKEDTDSDVAYMADKIAGLRVFADYEGKMNLSLLDISGEVLVVPQFTLYGDVKKGKRPGFDGAAPPEKGEELYMKVVQSMRDMGLTVKTGAFGEHMMVSLVNDGPVTILISSSKEF
ncbi:MAG TPA: D-aminoacyl-tRNA deacylase [Bacillota bacterium]|nr:D-tyrosyl-tRNA(Tyr) deacylase [Candidatus Fermentithermobacillaceae bacterium]HOB30709.1 D-aminoacyl-tRNA deacylase [Bacillota bacterium]HOK64565.1 D-aminoacyl-tRNA deacylase [Bacillota bacterium]HOL12078.1 D-aminoacyl-tRNA deacylase [Bacillota bacterium]HOQ03086.1 D-aminoacyl-tRNA deacylase [Bacillota bacterium]